MRNYQARNMLRDSMKKGDLAFFYHSSCDVPGIAGIVSVVEAEAIRTRPPSIPSIITTMPIRKPDAPRWFVVDVKLVRKFKRIITLDELRKHAAMKLDGFRFAAPWESSVGDAGVEEGMGFRSHS